MSSKLVHDGDGAMDEDVTVVQIRNMLASPDFEEAIQNVKEIGTEKEIMGPYMPNSFYTTTGAFEVLATSQVTVSVSPGVHVTEVFGF